MSAGTGSRGSARKGFLLPTFLFLKKKSTVRLIQIVDFFVMAVAVFLQTGACRNQLTDQDVLLQAGQRVNLALDGCIGQDTGGLLDRKSVV